jgi:hypothetical protein
MPVCHLVARMMELNFKRNQEFPFTGFIGRMPVNDSQYQRANIERMTA